VLVWYRQQVKDHGLPQATRLLGRVALSRSRVKLANKMLPVTVACPCCGWQGRRFFDYLEVGYTVPNAACPQCDSHPRHRYLSLWLSREFKLEDKSGTALIFAPEKALASFWSKAPGLDVVRIDLEGAREVDTLADIKNLPIRSNSIDLIWCHHVLEHVDDDRAAIRELYRVLRPGSGELVVSVPMTAPGTMTEEYGFADLTQSGHWRIYGDDFETRLTESGFTVQAVQFNLREEDYRRYAFQPERFYVCRKDPT
jgi:SAM-dependent methyltransferase